MSLRVLASARDEIREAFDFYNDQKEGLGAEFAREVAVMHLHRKPGYWRDRL